MTHMYKCLDRKLLHQTGSYYVKPDVDDIISIMKIELVTEVIQMSHAPELYVWTGSYYIKPDVDEIIFIMKIEFVT